MTRLRSLLAALAGVYLVTLLAPAAASAHTVQICWKDVGPVTTFYAGTYHQPSEGPSPIGGIIIDGFTYPFSGWIPRSALPSDAHCWSAPGFYKVTGDPDGVPSPSVVHFQTFTSAFAAGSHTFGFTSITAVEWPITAFPPQTFGGGACGDADFDGLCNDVDACPLDFSNDGDGDGICGNVDNCPLNANPDQTDLNRNGQGDVCEGVKCGNGLLQGSEQCDDGNIAGGDGCSALCTIEKADSPPNANAGTAFSVNEGQTAILDGTLSNDPDNDGLSYFWVQLTGTPVALAGGTTSQPTFTAPPVALGGETLTFKLTVTANGLSDDDTVSVTIANVNHQPVADAGDKQTVAEGAPVTLDGSNSYDTDADTLSYVWTQVSGPTVILTGDTTATPSLVAPVMGTGGAPGIVATLVFQLAVNDGYTTPDVVDTVTVEVTNVNNQPTASAGFDQTLNENSAVTLNGNGSTDPDGDLLTYSWVQVGGPAVTLTGAATATPGLTTPFVNAGGADLTFRLTTDDGYGGTSVDEVVVHVQNANDPPLVTAARPTVACIWPPNHSLVSVGIVGVSDPDDNATIVIDSVTQDEPTSGLGDGDTPVDAIINNDGTVLLRAERSGKGDGRVYHIRFTASDQEGSASGVVTVCVPHDRNKPAVDGGKLFDSTR